MEEEEVGKTESEEESSSLKKTMKAKLTRSPESLQDIPIDSSPLIDRRRLSRWQDEHQDDDDDDDRILWEGLYENTKKRQ